MPKSFLFLALALILTAGCPPADEEIEGDEAGECSDGADNDQDGAADCADTGCAADLACAGDDDDATGDDDDATGDDDDSAGDDDDATGRWCMARPLDLPDLPAPPCSPRQGLGRRRRWPHARRAR